MQPVAQTVREEQLRRSLQGGLRGGLLIILLDDSHPALNHQIGGTATLRRQLDLRARARLRARRVLVDMTCQRHNGPGDSASVWRATERWTVFCVVSSMINLAVFL